MRDDVMAFMRKLAEQEHAAIPTEDMLFIECGFDSFGTVLFFAELDDKHKCFPVDFIDSTDFTSLTIKMVVDRIVDETSKH